MNCLHAYQESVSTIITPLLGKLYDSSEQLNDEICLVSQQLLAAGQKTPKRRQKWYNDQALARLAAQKKIKTCAEFRKKRNICAANEERKRTP